MTAEEGLLEDVGSCEEGSQAQLQGKRRHQHDLLHHLQGITTVNQQELIVVTNVYFILSLSNGVKMNPKHCLQNLLAALESSSCRIAFQLVLNESDSLYS